jgi:hypothetical protein
MRQQFSFVLDGDEVDDDTSRADGFVLEVSSAHIAGFIPAVRLTVKTTIKGLVVIMQTGVSPRTNVLVVGHSSSSGCSSKTVTKLTGTHLGQTRLGWWTSSLHVLSR